MKIFSYLLIVIGVVCLSIGGWEWYSTAHQQDRALAKAEELVSHLPEKGVSQNNPRVKEKADKVKSNDVIGLLILPGLDRKLPIVEGTDLKQLKKGVGHYSGTALPGGDDQIFLAGHRDTVFKGLGDLKKGDEIIIKMSYGVFKYKMTDSKIVASDDRSIIKSTAPKETLILATCYPFVFVGNAPDRYILYAEPV